jgi:hypothetical protein
MIVNRLQNLWLMMTCMFIFFPVWSQVYQPPTRKLEKKDLLQKDMSELLLMRNAIFAQYGRPFKTYELHAFFSAQPWYKPNKEYAYSMLSAIDKDNIQLITTRENELMEEGRQLMATQKQTALAYVTNRFQFPPFSPSELTKLSAQGFIAGPAEAQQLFHIYENNDYLGIPSFITTDALLQLNHLFFDMVLRETEQQFLVGRLTHLLVQMEAGLKQMQSISKEPKVRDAIDFNLAYIGAAYYFLTSDKIFIQGTYKSKALEDVSLCDEASSWHESPLFGRMMDYSLFTPRGHYTKSEELKRYFKAMTWLGNAGIDLKNESQGVLSAVLLSHLLHHNAYQYKQKPLIYLWEDIYEPTSFFAGSSDDAGPVEMMKAIRSVFGEVQHPDAYLQTAQLKKVSALLPKASVVGHGSWGAQGKQFRLFGQRFTPDAFIFQRLTNNKRKQPNGVEVMAGFGNAKALDILVHELSPTWKAFEGYLDTLQTIISENRTITSEEWKKDLYHHTLYNLLALFEHKEDVTRPFFMTTEAWERKVLNTSLSSWAQLKHSTVLYSKQNMGAECGGEGEELTVWIPEPPKGYVEPYPEFYHRVHQMLNMMVAGLKNRKMLDNKTAYLSREIMDLLQFLHSVSVKELEGKPLSLQEYQQIQKVGSLLDNLSLSILSEGVEDWWEIDGPDKNMPIIVDVATVDSDVLHVGVGKAQELYVVVEIEGKLRLCRGAIFSYYEFLQTESKRLTDQEWQDLLQEQKQPEQPSWIRYKSPLKKEKKLIPLYKPAITDIPDSSTEPGWKLIYYDTGC